MELIARLQQQLNGLEERSLIRRRRTVDTPCAPRLTVEGRAMLAFCSNDYLGLAAHPRIESLSFGMMDFVSAHRGAIPASAMSATGQFEHPLVLRAKLEISAACHAFAKTPSHCVVTEFKDTAALAWISKQLTDALDSGRFASVPTDD